MALIASWIALAIIVVIGLNLLLHKAQRREDRGRGRPLPEGVADPADMRRTRPFTNRLLGAVLLAAVLVIVLAQRAALFPNS